MIVTNILTLDISELSERKWRKLFDQMRYTALGEIYEPWKIKPDRNQVELPRGAWSLLPDNIEYVDLRVAPHREKLDFIAELDATLPDGRTFERQREAMAAIIKQEQGLVVRPPGSGKTNIVLGALAAIPTLALVLVHTEDILQQWLDYISSTLPNADAGVIRANEFHIGDITVATVQTFRRRLDEDPSLAKAFGAVVLDEAHHAAATSFDTILNRMHGRYRIGVTATDKRADERHPYMKLVIGPVIHNMPFRSKVPVQVVPVREHKFYYRMRGSWDYRSLLNELISDPARNHAIARNADRMIRKGHSVLILSREILHLKGIDSYMKSDTELLTGERTKTERKEILRRFRAGEVKCILATQLADEALDVPILSCVILTYPGKHDGRIIQQVGRALREHPDKEEAFILDVVDEKVGVLRNQWMKRRAAYKKMRIPIKKRPQAKAKWRIKLHG